MLRRLSRFSILCETGCQPRDGADATAPGPHKRLSLKLLDVCQPVKLFALLLFGLHSRIRGLALDPRQRECPGFRPKNGQNRPLASGNHSAQPRRMPLQSMVHSGKLIIRARQARFGAQSPVPGRLPALAGVPFGPTGPDQTHLVLPRRGPFCLQDANPRPSGQALPWSLLIHRMLTVSSPYPLPMHTVSSR